MNGSSEIGKKINDYQFPRTLSGFQSVLAVEQKRGNLVP